jgi:hypothetical protein
MTRAGQIEVAAIGIVAAAGWLIWPHISFPKPLWRILLGLSALLFAQSLVRDVAILLLRRRSEAGRPRKEVRCLCLESAMGATGVLAAALIACWGGAIRVTLNRWEFFLAGAGIMVIGFVIKDLVVSWRPFGVRREQDHLNLIVRWKFKSK